MCAVFSVPSQLIRTAKNFLKCYVDFQDAFNDSNS